MIRRLNEMVGAAGTYVPYVHTMWLQLFMFMQYACRRRGVMSQLHAHVVSVDCCGWCKYTVSA
jgi:hypothetical protein